jgi:hypothetical protein
MDDKTIILIQIFVGAIVSLIPSTLIAYYGYKQFKKNFDLNVKTQPLKNKVTEGDAVEKFAGGYSQLVDDLQIRLDKMEVRQDEADKKIAAQGKRISYLESGVRKLVKQVKELGGDPVFNLNGDE